jgi:hypothetical protein
VEDGDGVGLIWLMEEVTAAIELGVEVEVEVVEVEASGLFECPCWSWYVAMTSDTGVVDQATKGFCLVARWGDCRVKMEMEDINGKNGSEE